jgi:hypothetical protein
MEIIPPTEAKASHKRDRRDLTNTTSAYTDDCRIKFWPSQLKWDFPVNFIQLAHLGVQLVSQPKLFKYRHFQPDSILLCVRWYLRYSLSYRDLEEMMAERSLSVDHTTIYRWVLYYAPLLRKLYEGKEMPS